MEEDTAESAYDPVAGCGFDFYYYFNNSLFFTLQAICGIMFEDDGNLKYVTAGAGFSIIF
jgi:hypothetical protein